MKKTEPSLRDEEQSVLGCADLEHVQVGGMENLVFSAGRWRMVKMLRNLKHVLFANFDDYDGQKLVNKLKFIARL